MKLFILGLAFVATACAQFSPSADYLPPQQESVAIEIAAPSSEYLAPAGSEQTILADDGYRYKTLRRLRHRQRRDVSELPGADYLPPHQEAAIEIAAPSNEYLAPAFAGETVVADDGYRYKTVRRFRNRNRREVSAEYLPPNQEAFIELAAPSNEYLAPAVEEHTLVGNDGYRYKTLRRLRHRQRRDVSELPGADYLPPHQEAAIEIAAPSNEYLAPAFAAETVVADDGYRYKTVRRFRNRNRREVSAEYLPPNQEAVIEFAAPSNEYLAPAVEEHTVLANDGYRYKTQRRLRHRQRRDVSELASAEYLPPHQEAAIELAAPSNEYLAPAFAAETVVADDGYRYKTVKKFKLRRH